MLYNYWSILRVRTFASAAASFAAAAEARALFAAVVVWLTTAGFMDGLFVGAIVVLVGALRTAPRCSWGIAPSDLNPGAQTAMRARPDRC